MNCFPGKTHTFDPTSGWCRNGCGVRDDGYVTRKGDVIRTPEEHAAIRRQIDPRGDD